MSYIHFHAEANSIEDLKRQLREALGGSEPTIQPNLLHMSNTGVHDPDLGKIPNGVAGAPGETKTTGSTEPDREQEQPKAEPEQQPAPQPEQPAKTYDLVAVRAAANAYKDKHGIEKLREIFKKHGGEKLKDIPEKNYAALMEDIA